jgi:hypothetical protein
MGLKLNIKGKKFGKLTALKELKERTSSGQVQWEFQCSCGNKSIHAGSRVKTGQILSCGCGRKTDNPTESLVKIMFRDYQASAKTRDIQFNISYDLFKQLTQNACFYCDAPPELRIRKFTAKANGVDRIDSSKPYEAGNVRSCCKICNIAKNDLTDKEFRDWIDRLVEANRYQ